MIIPWDNQGYPSTHQHRYAQHTASRTSTSHALRQTASDEASTSSSAESTLATPTADEVWCRLFGGQTYDQGFSVNAGKAAHQYHRPQHHQAQQHLHQQPQHHNQHQSQHSKAQHHLTGCDAALAEYLLATHDCDRCEEYVGDGVPDWVRGGHQNHRTVESAAMRMTCEENHCSAIDFAPGSSSLSACCEAEHPPTCDAQYPSAACCEAAPMQSTCSVASTCESSAVQCSDTSTLCLEPPCSDPHCSADAAAAPAPAQDPDCGICDSSAAIKEDDCDTCQVEAQAPHHQHCQATRDFYSEVQAILDCCYCLPSASATATSSTCCPSTAHQHQHLDGSNTSTTASSLPSGASTPHDVYGGNQTAELDNFFRGDCHFRQPHRHDVNGLCLAPDMTVKQPYPQISAGRQFKDIGAQRSTHFQNTFHKAHQCKWAGCSSTFGSIEELVSHVHDTHLTGQCSAAPTSSALQSYTEHQHPTPSQGAHLTQWCQWDSCSTPHQLPQPQQVAMSNADPVQTMIEHLLSNHIEAQPSGMASYGQQQTQMHPPFQWLHHSRTEAHQQYPRFMPALPSKPSLTPMTSALPTPAIAETDGSPTEATAGPSRATLTPISEDEQLCDQPLVCRWKGCSEVFHNYSAFTDHISDVHIGRGKSVYVCEWEGCERAEKGRTFQQRQKVLRHVQTHTSDKPFKCEECGRRFSEKNTLQQHQRTHSGQKPYKCDWPDCNASFAVQGSLTIHKRSRHTMERPFACNYPGCDRRFAESSNLAKHRRLHESTRPYGCETCGKKFSRSDQLARHSKVHDKKRKGGDPDVDESSFRGRSSSMSTSMSAAVSRAGSLDGMAGFAFKRKTPDDEVLA